METISVVGKQNFKSKSGKDCFILHICGRRENIEGFEAKTQFVDSQLFNRVQINKAYEVVYACGYNGKAFIADLIPVASNEANND